MKLYCDKNLFLERNKKKREVTIEINAVYKIRVKV